MWRLRKLKMKKIIMFSLILIIISSCTNNDLTREKATELIKANLPFDKIGKGEFLISSCMDYGNHGEDNQILQNEGLLKISKINCEIGFTTLSGWRCSLTEKGKEFQLSQERRDGYSDDMYIDVCTMKYEFLEVTGVANSKNDNSAEVHFTITRKLTPFGKVDRKLKKSNITDGVIEKTINCTRFDDGWRIN